MLSKVLGSAKFTALMKKLRGGPGAMLPMSPGKGYGVKSMKGLTPLQGRQYIVPKQNPLVGNKGLAGLGKRKGRL